MMKLRINLSKFTFADIFTAALFILLIVTTALVGNVFKGNAQLVLLFVGITALSSLFAKAPYKTSIPFYLLLLILFFGAFVYWVTRLAGILIPQPEQLRHVSNSAVFGLVASLFLAPISLYFYHRLNQRNTVLEAA